MSLAGRLVALSGGNYYRSLTNKHRVGSVDLSEEGHLAEEVDRHTSVVLDRAQDGAVGQGIALLGDQPANDVPTEKNKTILITVNPNTNFFS